MNYFLYENFFLSFLIFKFLIELMLFFETFVFNQNIYKAQIEKNKRNVF